MIITINNPPVPWKRAGHSGTHFYDSQKHDKFAIGIHLRNAMKSKEPFQCPIKVVFQFYLPIPKKMSPTRKNQTNNAYYPYKPDLDNLVKMYLDSANGIIYKDDCQVVEISSVKKYGLEPKVIMEVLEI